MNRRDFLKCSSAGAAALSAGAWPLRAQGSANERLGIGMIGAGGRGADLMAQLLALAENRNLQIAAICDVWQKNLQAAAAKVKARTGREPRQLARFGDLLALKEVDAVVIATPDFSHAPILIAALNAGKDAYVEKPMTIDIPSANQALDLARAKERVVQVGTQYRSDGHYLGAAKLLASGVLGKLSRVSVAMNFNQPRWARPYADCLAADVDWEAYLLHLPKRPFDAKLLRRWHLFRECTNGLSGLWMSHYADAVHFLTGAKYPASAVALGGIYVWHDGREHTDTFHALLDYPEGFLFNWGMGLGNSAGTHFTVHGTKGTMDLQAWTISPAGGVDTTVQAGPIEPVAGPAHMDNWVSCLRTRQRPNADIQFGHQHAVATVMAATALQTGQRQRYDPATRRMAAG
jgi:predicted dehydrogenase